MGRIGKFLGSCMILKRGIKANNEKKDIQKLTRKLAQLER
jgi:hypothetical protein